MCVYLHEDKRAYYFTLRGYMVIEIVPMITVGTFSFTGGAKIRNCSTLKIFKGFSGS